MTDGTVPAALDDGSSSTLSWSTVQKTTDSDDR
jgi:hypothetical protein